MYVLLLVDVPGSIARVDVGHNGRFPHFLDQPLDPDPGNCHGGKAHAQVRGRGQGALINVLPETQPEESVTIELAFETLRSLSMSDGHIPSV
jgi:hypothetical protein